MVRINPVSQHFIQAKNGTVYNSPTSNYTCYEEEKKHFVTKRRLILGCGLLASIIGLVIYFRKSRFLNVK